MKNLDFEELWNNVLKFVGISALTVFTVMLFIFLFADHSVRYYYLAQSDGCLEIIGDIDYGQDNIIRLDRNITYDQAIKLVNDLNNSLVNK